MKHITFYIATVCLERNRWGSRVPSFAVGDWLSRFAADGFDGIELWENHYVKADAGERARLVELAAPVAVFNSYASFADNGAESREQAATAISRLHAQAVKYNLGGDPTKLTEYRRNLLAWEKRLPESCRLLCECHAGTVLERPEDAAAFFADLDPARFQIIVHIPGRPETVEDWFARFGARVGHLHVQMRELTPDTEDTAGPRPSAEGLGSVRKNGFCGSVCIEFTRGIGRDENIEQLYANACVDLNFCRKVLL